MNSIKCQLKLQDTEYEDKKRTIDSNIHVRKENLKPVITIH